jgi:hypothetical protein
VEVNDALGEREGKSRPFERSLAALDQYAAQCPIVRCGSPNKQLQNYGTITELFNKYLWFRLLMRPYFCGCDVKQHLLALAEIGVVANAKAKVDKPLW